MYLDRLRILCQRTIQQGGTPEEQIVLNREANRRLLAAFINGLAGVPGRHVRTQMPDTLDKALNMAIIATQAEKSERSNLRDDRVDKQKCLRQEATAGTRVIVIGTHSRKSNGAHTGEVVVTAGRKEEEEEELSMGQARTGPNVGLLQEVVQRRTRPGPAARLSQGERRD
jgi:hypothetical protein